MAGNLYGAARRPFFDKLGALNVGGSLEFFITETSTPLAVFTDSLLSAGSATTLTLDAVGRTENDVYLQQLSYKVIHKDSADVTIWTQDPVSNVLQLSLDGTPSVDLISDLTALLKASLSNDNVYRVQGYATIGDGGGGDFVWASASSATANGGTIIASGEGGTGRWLRMFTKLNPIMFGSLGDGATDDATTVQAVIDAIASTGVELDWLEKTYRLNSVITAEYDNLFWTGNADLSINHAGVGVELGGTSGRSRHFNITLGKVTATGSAYASGSVGVRIRNYSFFTLRFSHLQGPFERGLSLVSSDSEGISYGDIQGQRITSNKFGVHVITETGTFANDVTYRINRIGNTAADPDSSGGYHVYLDGAGGGDVPAAHRFFGTTFESPAITAGNLESAFYDDGTRNETIGCYFEGSLGWDLHPIMIKQGPNYIRDSVYHFANGFNGVANVSLLSATGRTTILGGSTQYHGGGDGVDPHVILQEVNNNTNTAFASRDTSGAATFSYKANGQFAFNGKTPAAPPDYTAGTFTTRRIIPDAASVTLEQLADVVSSMATDLINNGNFE